MYRMGSHVVRFSCRCTQWILWQPRDNHVETPACGDEIQQGSIVYISVTGASKTPLRIVFRQSRTRFEIKKHCSYSYCGPGRRNVSVPISC